MGGDYRMWMGALPLLAAVGCGGDGAPVGLPDPDSGMPMADTGPLLEGSDPTLRYGSAPTREGFELAPPDIPWLADGEPAVAPPVLTPCPAGWEQVTDDTGVDFCEPWAPGATTDCPAGEAQIPGNAACAPLGAACPSGTYADDLPAGRPRVHVLAGAPAGGDGSLASPYATLAEVPFGTLAADTVVALGAGTYEGPVVLGGNVALWGTCAAGTTLVTSTAGPEPIVSFQGTGNELRNVSVGLGGRVGVGLSEAGAEALLVGVDVRSAGCFGIVVEGGTTLTADGLAVRDTAFCTSGAFGTGVEVRDGGTAQMRRALFARNLGMGVRVLSAGQSTAVTLEDAVIRNGAAGTYTEALGDGAAAQLTLSRVLLEGTLGFSTELRFAGAVVNLEDSVVRDTTGTMIFAGGRVESRRTSFSAVFLPLLAFQGGTLSLEDALIADSVGQGPALTAYFSPDTSVRRLVMARNRAVQASNLVASASTFHAEDVRILQSAAGPEVILNQGMPVPSGVGLEINSVEGEVRRLVIEQVRAEGIRMRMVPNPQGGVLPGDVLLEDVVVRDTLPSDHPLVGGLSMSWNGEPNQALTLRRALFEGAQVMGLDFWAGGAVTMEDIIVRDTRGYEPTGLYGGGVLIEGGNKMAMHRVHIEDQRDVGLLVRHSGTEVSMEDVSVEHTAMRQCADTGDTACAAAGHGLVVYAGAQLAATRFAVRDSGLCGLQLAQGGSVDLSGGEISGALIGVCLQQDPYDIARLSEEVSYVDNGSNLQATRLPVPNTGASELE